MADDVVHLVAAGWIGVPRAGAKTTDRPARAVCHLLPARKHGWLERTSKRSAVAGSICGWSEHPHLPRERIVAAAVNVRWIGFERPRRGTWPG
jgi:hypothetical protein